MSTGFRSTIDTSRAVRAAHEGITKGLGHATEFLLTEANRSVPHDDGTLERSGTTEVQDMTGAVGYDTPYAVKQHEDTSLHHDGKGQAKWLENTFTGRANEAGQIIATATRSEVGS